MASTLAVGTKINNLVEVPVEPNSISFGINDISASDSGRVMDANRTMYKNRVARKRKMSLSWSNPTLAQTSAILKMFSPVSFYVRYLDPEDGEFRTRHFYAGDMTSPFRQISLYDPQGNKTVMTSLSFDIVEV